MPTPKTPIPSELLARVADARNRSGDFRVNGCTLRSYGASHSPYAVFDTTGWKYGRYQTLEGALRACLRIGTQSTGSTQDPQQETQ